MKIALNTLWLSITRSLVPYIVGGVVAFLATTNIPVDPEFEVALGGALTVLFGLIYQVAARLLETYVSPKFSWLLGSNKQPLAYAKPDATSDGVPVITDVKDATTVDGTPAATIEVQQIDPKES